MSVRLLSGYRSNERERSDGVREGFAGGIRDEHELLHVCRYSRLVRQ